MGLLDSIKNVFGGDDEEKKAAEALLTLINDLQNNRECSILNGPCSKA